MPRMATLSRIPLAIFNLLSESRRGLPEIPPETAILVERLDSEHHPQIGADIQRVTRKIGEFGHHPSAADKVDIAIIARRVWRIGQRVGGPGHHLRRHLGEWIILLRADGMVVGVDAHLALRELHRPGLGAAPADEAEHRLAIRSEEHTSELQSLMRHSYSVLCL